MKWSIYFLGCLLLLSACSKDETLPDNPFDKIDYGQDGVAVDSLDPNGIVAIHRDILLPKCSTPGCHDGTFEPDFRTVMSSYSTLVFHPIIKNDPDSQYTYRVVPYDTTFSVLQKRLNWKTFANTNDRMPQDNIGRGLPKSDLDRISNWILAGARDFQGNVPVFPNSEPTMQYYWMVEGGSSVLTTPQPYNVLSGSDNRVEGRGDYSAIVDTSMRLLITADIVDDSTKMANMKNVKLAFSYTQDDFSSPIFTQNGQYLNYGSGEDWYFLFTVPKTFLEDTTIYMRIYANDGDHVDDTYFPTNESYSWYKTYWSITVKAGSHQ